MIVNHMYMMNDEVHELDWLWLYHYGKFLRENSGPAVMLPDFLQSYGLRIINVCEHMKFYTHYISKELTY